MSCQRFSFATSGNVGVRELVDEHDLRAARDDRVDVELLEDRVAIRSIRRGTTSRSRICSAVFGRSVRLDEADDDVGAALPATPTLVEHRVGLADAGRRPEVDPQPTFRHRQPLCERAAQGFSLPERKVEIEHVHGLLAEESELRVVGVRLDQVIDRSQREVACVRDARSLQVGVGRRDVGIEPESDAVTASTGTFAPAAPR